MSKEWKQERPTWCPYPSCIFKRRVMDSICGGELPVQEPHDGDMNTHRICINGVDSSGGVVPLQVNKSDLDWFRWVFDALDDKKTGSLSLREFAKGWEIAYRDELKEASEK